MHKDGPSTHLAPAGAGARATRRVNNHATLTGAAREIFVERGYHGASIRDIAARAGMSLSALYYWYASKQDLLAALLAEGRREYVEACRDALAEADPDDPAGRLAAMVRATVDYRVRRRAESALTAQEWRHLEPHHLADLDGYRIEAARMWNEVVEVGARSGAFGCAYPDDARRAVQAACNAIAEWYDPAGSVTAGELAERYVAIALRIVEYTSPAPSSTEGARHG